MKYSITIYRIEDKIHLGYENKRLALKAGKQMKRNGEIFQIDTVDANGILTEVADNNSFDQWSVK